MQRHIDLVYAVGISNAKFSDHYFTQKEATSTCRVIRSQPSKFCIIQALAERCLMWRHATTMDVRECEKDESAQLCS